jgi:two-component system, LytTR family, sensor histidine kinase AlgZ
MQEDRNVTVSPGMAWLAGLPIFGCMVIMGLPSSITDSKALAFRLFYTLSYLAWIVPLGWLQRVLWRRGASWWTMAAVLLPATYAMSVCNAVVALETLASPEMRAKITWVWIFGGLDGCWLALIAFCGLQAMVLHRAALRAEGERLVIAAQATRDAELRALKYQLQPHFLFNTLNAISSLVNDDRKRDASRMIARLGDFLRATLEETRGHEVTVGDEVVFTAAYLDIEKARFGERLRVDIQTGPDTLDALVPHLLLQPLVENAIRHGIAPREEGGAVSIRVRREDDTLRIDVENDRFENMQSIGHGVGLANVRARLNALHPDAHRFEAGPVGAQWRVTVELPWRLSSPVKEVE